MAAGKSPTGPEEEQHHAAAGRVMRLRGIDFSPYLGMAQANYRPRPLFITSPLRADGAAPCTGIMFMLKRAVTAPSQHEPLDPEGFLVTVWIQNPVTSDWGASAPVRVPYDTWFRSFDFNGGGLYFQIQGSNGGADAELDIHIVEL